MKIALFGKSFSENFTDSFILMFDVFAKQNVEVFIFEPFYDFLIRKSNLSHPLKVIFQDMGILIRM